ncbi:hypothetical protein [Nocardioides psychrotolerans]|uniref:hypothetical protein n=1 Tax=Nocardioides psychrotolerans TaxID=1005945 RepID=UPI0031378EE4
MTDHTDLIAFRRHTRKEAAVMLNVPDTWLKVWVTADKVPHQRSGQPGPRQRGVWFTYDDILAIGRLLPSLMTGRQANGRAESPAEQPASEPIVSPEVGADLLGQFAGLRSLRTRT